jgi:S1-C subfamily serine protease
MRLTHDDSDSPESLPAQESGESRRARLAKGARSVGPFALGVLAALIGLLIFNALTPRPESLTEKQVNTAIARAMASATPPPAYSARAYQVIQPSLVLIETNGFNLKGRGGRAALQNPQDNTALGTGVVISDQGDILTALHVVQGASDISITFADGSQSKATIASAQVDNDIAVLKPDQAPEVIVPAVMGNPNAVRVGDEAFVVGNPFGLEGSMSSGVISGLHRTFEAKDINRTVQDLIQVDSAVNPGNSGGPLLNRDGQVIGIVVALLNPTDQEFFVGIGFAVPIATAAGAAGAPQY